MEFFSELISIPAPPGREERLAEKICQILLEIETPYSVDGAGNITVPFSSWKKNGEKVIFAAHMDEIGMVVTGINGDGSLRVDRSGGLFPCKIGECPVEIIGDGETLKGVLSIGSMHRSDAGELKVAWKDVRIITGLTEEQLRKAGVREGSSAVPESSHRGPVYFGDETDPLVAAWTFDDRMGVAALLRLLEESRKKRIEPSGPAAVCFTVHEEGGCHGAKVVAQRERPGIFIAVDGSPIPPGVDLKLDGRPCIWSKDKITNFDQALIGDFRDAAARAGTELQVAVYDAAASDASKVYEVGGAERVATIGHVRENSHGYEVARLSVFQNVVAILVEYLSEL